MTCPQSNGIWFQRLINKEKHKAFIELIKCKICFNILLNPYDCSVCGNSFCYECINSLMDQKKNCPFKCVSYSINPSSFSITSYLSSIQFECLNKQNGCNKIINYSDRLIHDKECKYFYTKCPNNSCNKKLQWTLLEKHILTECEYSVLKCKKCEMDLIKNEFEEHVANCSSIKQSLNYTINKNQLNKQQESQKTIDELLKHLPEIKEMSLVSFLRILLYQINENNKTLNYKFDSMKEEMKSIHEDINRISNNNIIFFESINNELDNLNHKYDSIELNENIKANIHESVQNAIGTSQNDTLPFLFDDKKLLNNSLMSDITPTSKRVKFAEILESTEKFKINKNQQHQNQKQTKGDKKVKSIQLNKNTNLSTNRKANEMHSPKHNGNNYFQSNPNSILNEVINITNLNEQNKRDNTLNQPISRPFNTFSNFTNSNLVTIINNQEIILQKINGIEKKLKDKEDKINKELNETQDKYINSMLLNQNSIHTNKIDVYKFEQKEDKISNEILNGNIEDMKNKMKIMELDNQKINEHLFSLQNKFYVQTKILNDKNAELSKEVSKAQKMKSDYDKLSKEANNLKTQLDNNIKFIESLQSENKKLRNEMIDLNKKYNESNLKTNYLIGQLEEQNSILSSQNVSLKESSTKLQTQLDFTYNEMKAKESKLIFTFKNENKDIEKNLREEIIQLKKQNESFLQETEQLKKDKIIVSNELENVINESKNLAKSTFISCCNNNNELQLSAFVNDNKELKDKITSIESIALINDKKIKALKLDLQQSEKENNAYYNMLKEKEIQISSLEQNIESFKSQLEQQPNIEILMKENNSKNETINYLLDQIEKTKQELLSNQKEFEIKFAQMNLNHKILNDKILLTQKEYEEAVKSNQEKLNDLRRENEILINDLNNKENEYNELLNQKVLLEAKYDEQFQQAEDKCNGIQKNISNITKENDSLKEQINQCLSISTDKFNSFNDKLLKQKQKMDSLMIIYETHVKFIKDRFDHILNDLLIVFNLKSNPKELNDNFAKIIKSIENSIDLINKIAEREALIENFKTELKTLKNNLTNSTNQIKALEKENYELAQAANVKKLQMKLKLIKQEDLMQYDVFTMLQEMSTITELNVQNCSLKLKVNNQSVEMKLLNDKILTFQEQYKSIESKYNDKTDELEIKSKELSDLNKTYKMEIKNLVDEVKRIKETWMPYEKKMELMNIIESLEKTNKGAKEDLNRKREMIISLKNQIAKNDNDKTFINNKDSDINVLNEKMKSLTKDINRKDGMIKELKSANDYLKSKDQKMNDEIESLSEKVKLNKVEINRKDIVIKELKDKINAISNTQSAFNYNNSTNSSTVSQKTQKQEKLMKFKYEIERKDNIIKTLKAKNEAYDIELNQMKTLTMKNNKISMIDLEKEQKLRNNDQEKINELSMTIEKMASCFRLLYKDMINSYEKIQSKLHLSNITNTMKEGMNILGVNENEVNDYLNPNNENQLAKTSTDEKIEKMLGSEGKFFDCINMINLLNSITEKINRADFNYQKNFNADSFYPSNINEMTKTKENTPFEKYFMTNHLNQIMSDPINTYTRIRNQGNNNLNSKQGIDNLYGNN